MNTKYLFLSFVLARAWFIAVHAQEPYRKPNIIYNYFGYLDQKQSHNYFPSHLWENDQIVAL